jgi:hypothetical protein
MSVQSQGPPLWSSAQSSWLQNWDVLCFLWGKNWIYICYVEESNRLCVLVLSVLGYRTEMYCFLWGTNWICICYVEESNRLCGLVLRVPCLQIQRSGFDFRRYQISWEVVGLERGPLSLVGTTEELLGRKSIGSDLENRYYGRRDSSRWPRGTIYPQKLALTSTIRGGLSVCIVRSQTQAKEYSFFSLPHFIKGVYLH